MTYNSDSIAQQAAVDLLLATLHSAQPEASQSQLEQWFQRYAIPIGFADIAGADVCHKLRALLTHLDSRSACSALSAAVHASILALTNKIRFREAVEQESRRQIYNFVYGLTHEINNPLANISARAQQLMSTCQDAAAAKSLGTIVDQSMRAHEMLAESMNAVRPPKVEFELVDIVKVISESVARARLRLGTKGIEIYTHPMPSNLFSTASRSLLGETLESLIQNAAEACGPGDRIDLLAEPLEVGDPDEAKLNGSIGQIRIAIRDTGRGISSSDLNQVWDLYYSGRESGRGLGISLAKARRAIEGFGGKIWLISNPNAGTTVEIRLAIASPPSGPRRILTL